MALPNASYNCMMDFLKGHSHCIKIDGHISELTDIWAKYFENSEFAHRIAVAVTMHNSIWRYFSLFTCVYVCMFVLL